MARKVGQRKSAGSDVHPYGNKPRICFGCGISTTVGVPNVQYTETGKRSIVWRCPKCKVSA